MASKDDTLRQKLSDYGLESEKVEDALAAIKEMDSKQQNELETKSELDSLRALLLTETNPTRKAAMAARIVSLSIERGDY